MDLLCRLKWLCDTMGQAFLLVEAVFSCIHLFHKSNDKQECLSYHPFTKGVHWEAASKNKVFTRNDIFCLRS